MNLYHFRPECVILYSNQQKMKIHVKRQLIAIVFLFSGIPLHAQWEPVMENVLIVDITVSPDFSNDETVFVINDQIEIYRSTDNGDEWQMVYQALDPYIDAEKVLDIVLSTDFKNDNQVIIVHLDGSAEASYDRGETWENQPVPAGTTSVIFSPDYTNDHTVYAATGASYACKFHRSVDKGKTWAETAILGNTGIYTRLFNSADPASSLALAIQSGMNEVLLSDDGGYNWTSASDDFTTVWDVAYSGNFSQDHTLFLSTARKIYKNTESGSYFAWTETYHNESSFGIDLAISPAFFQDHTLYAGIDQQGIYRSGDGGDTWTAFNSGLDNYYPVSLAIGGSEPIFSLFTGTQNPGGLPDRLWRYRMVDAVEEHPRENPFDLTVLQSPSVHTPELILQVDKTEMITISIISLSGKMIKTITEKLYTPGTYTFRDDNGLADLPGGLFLIRATSGTYSLVRKAVLFVD